MTYEEFRKAHPAKRGWQRYTMADRVERMSTPLKSSAWQGALGEHFYTHPMLPGRGYKTPKAATTAAFELYQAQQRKRIADPAPRIRIAVDLDEQEVL